MGILIKVFLPMPSVASCKQALLETIALLHKAQCVLDVELCWSLW